MEVLENKFVEVLDRDHGLEVKKFFEKYVKNKIKFTFNCTKEYRDTERYYGVIKGNVCLREKEEVTDNGGEIVTLEELENLVEVKKFPRLVRVWETNSDAKLVRIAIGSNSNGILCWTSADSLDKVDEAFTATIWPNYEEIKLVELTKQEIADKFNIDVNDLKIV